ncbi:hypothetical protein GUITHDRAFT_107299 [Guillardia theta CCMP2712]|uniref:Phosphatidic acid phosphatase type 2/haloperoxidase domain-containing protein n=1 Tax=Guillardia theta (strain CCMP2712) TaxID=905079 RepID=L1JF64_GUITC|nr:hypothetical protein GUITHDRAFT_107299 [Guillardia theta CCMP2712]EKX46947.1 hypothetical protein GUITHDRAFT_107299 [Guillardia theta CCMP2712]|eukprot:XP_005833927.1 hypothetical protein GUITHDRAFT_107299 [Guillardia theta CCMP2712]
MVGGRHEEKAVLLCFVITGIVNFYVAPHERIVLAGDPALSYPVGNQQVPESLLFVIAYFVPIAIIFFVSSSLDKSDFCVSFLALSQSVSLTLMSTTIAKKFAGRPRPCFFAMCGWVANQTGHRGAAGHCTGTTLKVWDSRQSFPSGHASFSMAGLGFLGLYLLDKLECQARQQRLLSPIQYQVGQVVSFVPFALAVWIAITRTMDYWHNFDDILAGAVLGFAWGQYCFSQRGRLRNIVVDDRRSQQRSTQEDRTGFINNENGAEAA